MILHIFRKDIRRLWPAVALSFVLLAALSHEDRWRLDRLPGLDEGWLNILLPLSWALLIALVIHEERLGDDREFWITRPYRRGALLAAKALFVIASIQLPALLADAYIVAGRGFSPVVYLPQLLAKQLLIAALLVVPAAAIAALTRTLAVFCLAAIGAPAAVLLLNSSLRPAPLREPEPNVRLALTIAVIAIVALIVVLLSYFGRRRLMPRALAVAGGLAGAAIFLFASPAFTARVRARLVHRPAAPSIRLDPRPPRLICRPLGTVSRTPSLSHCRSRWTALHPASHSGLAGSRQSLSHRAATAIRRPAIRPGRSSARCSRCRFLLSPRIVPTSSCRSTRASTPAWPPPRSGSPEARGFWIYRLGKTTSFPINIDRPVPDLGRCTAVETLDDQGYGLKVVCESPAGFLGYAPVRLISGRDGRQWQQALGDWGPFLTAPRQPWLSPVGRRQAFFRVTDEVYQSPGSRWLVPRSALDLAEISVTPYTEFGTTGVKFDFADVALSRFLHR